MDLAEFFSRSVDAFTAPVRQVGPASEQDCLIAAFGRDPGAK
jgi:hypothetical protein